MRKHIAVGASYILLNDIPVDQPTLPGAIPVELDIEALARIITEFASSTRVLLRTQRPPRNGAQAAIVEHKPLDEADVAIYLRDSPLARGALYQPDKIAELFRLTDGVPSRLDNALRELEVTSLDDLVSSNSDLGVASVAVAAPQALVAAVAELEASQDTAEQRAHALLKALAALPQGEQLGHIARLNGPIPFRPAHAIDLTARALLDSAPLTGIGAEDSTTSKALIVPRPVREYVRGRLNDQELRSLDRKLLELYFGDHWKSGRITGSRAGRRASDSLCPMHEITNASTLIVRLLRRAIEDEASNDIDTAVALASASCRVPRLRQSSPWRGRFVHRCPGDAADPRSHTPAGYSRAGACAGTRLFT